MTRAVQNHDLITVISCERNVDRRLGPGEFVDSRIRKKGSKKLMKSLKYKGMKGASPR
jgi:hypothetical protein